MHVQTQANTLAEGVMSVSYLLLIFPDGKGDWISDGCINKSRNLDTIVCECNHLSMFGVLVVCVCILCDLHDETMSKILRYGCSTEHGTSGM